MIRWLMVGLLLLTKSVCDSAAEKNAASNKNGDNPNAIGGSGVTAGPVDKAGLKAATTSPATADEEDVYRLTCYTCVNVSNNKVCNEWAIDTPCPDGGRDFCRSLHILDSRGESVLVSKSCVSQIDCHPRSVGCMPYDTQKVCISCCDTSYCNVESPTNATNATFSRKRRPRPTDDAQKNKGSGSHPAPLPSPALILLAGLLAFTAISVFLDRAYHY